MKVRWLLLLLVASLASEAESGCLVGKEFLRRYPESRICAPQLNPETLYFYDSANLKLAVHMNTAGVSAGLSGSPCKEDGLAYFCSALFPPCQRIPLPPGTPWPAIATVPRLPCVEVCRRAKRSCRDAPIGVSINCTVFQGNKLVIPELNTTVPCNEASPPPSSYKNSTLNCVYPLAYDALTDACGLSCPGKDYSEGQRELLLITTGALMIIVAASCLYVMFPMLHKGIAGEGFFRKLRIRHMPPRMVISKLMFLFLLNLFLNCLCWVPYLFTTSDSLWCTDGVFSKAYDNAITGILGFLQVAPAMACRGYLFLWLLDMEFTICFRKPMWGGPYVWTFLMTLPLLFYPPTIYAWATNQIGSVPSLHPIPYVLEETMQLNVWIVFVPLTIFATISLPLIAHILFVLIKSKWDSTRQSPTVGSSSTLKSFANVVGRYLRLLIWFTLYDIPALMTAIFDWYVHSRTSNIREGYVEQISCAISSLEPMNCKNPELLNATWLTFIGIFPLALVVPIVPVFAWGRKNYVHAWWRAFLGSFCTKLPPIALVQRAGEDAYSSGSSSQQKKRTPSSHTPVTQ
jgi:hypothetical protein